MKKKIIAIILTAVLVASLFSAIQISTMAYDVDGWVYDKNNITITGNDEEGFDITGKAWYSSRTWVLKEDGPKTANLKFKAGWNTGSYLYLAYQVNDNSITSYVLEGIRLRIDRLNDSQIKIYQWIGSSEYKDITGNINFVFNAEHIFGFSNIENKWYFCLDGTVYKSVELTDEIEQIYSICEQQNLSPQYYFTGSSDYVIENLQFINKEAYSITATFNDTDKYGISWHTESKQYEPQVQYGINKDADVLQYPTLNDWSSLSSSSVTGDATNGFTVSGSAARWSAMQKTEGFSDYELSFKMPNVSHNQWYYLSIRTSKTVESLWPQGGNLEGIYILLSRQYNDLVVQISDGTNYPVIIPKLVNFDFTKEHTIAFEKVSGKWYMSFDGVIYTEENGGTDLTPYMSILEGKTNYYFFSASETYEFNSIKFTPKNAEDYLYTAVAYSDYAENDDYCENGKDYSYKAVLSNLEAGQTCYYRIGDAATGAWTDWRSFKIQEGDSTPFTFLYFADTHVGGGAVDAQLWPVAMNSAVQKYADYRFILQAGDLVDNGADYSQYKTAFSNQNGGIGDYLKDSLFAPVTGNHEKWVTEIADHYNVYVPDDQEVANGIYYSYDYNDAHFVMLDMNDMDDSVDNPYNADFPYSLSDKQIEWLKNDLASTDKSWKIVGIHASLYGNGTMAQAPEVKGMKNRLIKIFDEYDVDLVLSGHDHSFQRTKPIYSRHDILEYWDSGTVRPGYRTNEEYNGDSVVFDVNPNGTVFMENGSIATNKAENHVAAYTSLYDKWGSPAEAMYSAITIDGDKLVMKTYTVADDGTTTLYDSYGLVRDNNVDINEDSDINICDLVSLSMKEEYQQKEQDIAILRKKLLSFFAR